MLNINNYFDKMDWIRLQTFAKSMDTPFILMHLESIRKKYQKLVKYFPHAKIYYAVKANPAIEIIRLLNGLGAYFDVASIYELEKVLSADVPPDRISYGNTIKKRKDICHFFERGVRLFATDSEDDLYNIAREAPGSKIYIRILTEESNTSDWPLSRKFGCHPEMAVEMMINARSLGLVPYGISFHVGSQQRDIYVWDKALADVRTIFHRLSQEDIKLKMINLGGGFPAHYLM